MRKWVFILILGLSTPVWAKDYFTKTLIFQTYYSGEDQKTFSSDNPGSGLEVEISTNEDIWNWIAKGRFTSISGSQYFLDSGSKINSSFTFYQSTFETGFAIYPLRKKKRAINLYFGATVGASFNYLQLSASNLNSLQQTDQSTSFGYNGIVGLEWYLFDSSSWCLSAEFTQRYETTKLAKQNSFGLNGFAMELGIGW